MSGGTRANRSTLERVADAVALILFFALCYLLPHEMMFVTTAEAPLRQQLLDESDEAKDERPDPIKSEDKMEPLYFSPTD